MPDTRALGRAIRSMISRGKVVLSAMGTRRTMMQVSILASEVKNGVELLLPYGMSALPAAGDAVLLAVAGLRDHLLALMVDDPDLRITDLGLGDYGFKHRNGTQIVLRGDRLEITATVPVAGSAPSWDLTGNVKVSGDLDVSGKLTCPDIQQ